MDFDKVKEKYKKYISNQSITVISLDATGVTRSHRTHMYPYDQMRGRRDNFCDVMKRTAKEMSERYGCIAYCSGDELNLICKIPPVRSNGGCTSTLRIGCCIAEQVFDYFNLHYMGSDQIFFDAHVFALKSRKQADLYLKARKRSCENAAVQYLAKEYLSKPERWHKTKAQLEAMLPEGVMDPYAKNGALFGAGKL